MIVSVLYYDEVAKGYGGRSYTYRTDLPLVPYQKVFAPTVDGLKKAIVRAVNLSESSIQPEWADKIKTITQLDTD